MTLIRRRNIDYTVPEPCLNQRGRYHIQNLVGSGVTGTVYDITIEDSDRAWVVKTTPLNVPIPSWRCDISYPTHDCEIVRTRDFLAEAKLTQALGEIGIAPQVFDYWVCSDPALSNPIQGHVDMGFIVMEKYDTTLADYGKRYPRQREIQGSLIDQRVDELVERMEEFGFAHEDLHNENIVVNYDDNSEDKEIIDIRLIDFFDVNDVRY